MTDTTKQIGDRGEALAKSYLIKNGYTILAENFRFRKAEVDIIAQKDDVLIIVEVKTRKLHSLIAPEVSVDLKKQKLLVMAAQAYIEEKDLELETRFDILSIYHTSNRYKVEHIEEVFYPRIR